MSIRLVLVVVGISFRFVSFVTIGSGLSVLVIMFLDGFFFSLLFLRPLLLNLRILLVIFTHEHEVLVVSINYSIVILL